MPAVSALELAPDQGQSRARGDSRGIAVVPPAAAAKGGAA
jgi:hypothetical protein